MTKQNNKRSHVTENDKTVVEKRQLRQKVTKQNIIMTNQNQKVNIMAMRYIDKNGM